MKPFFKTPNNFSRVFKKMLGVSPGVFCKKHEYKYS